MMIVLQAASEIMRSVLYQKGLREVIIKEQTYLSALHAVKEVMREDWLAAQQTDLPNQHI